MLRSLKCLCGIGEEDAKMCKSSKNILEIAGERTLSPAI